MSTSHGVIQGYNGVAVVDEKHQIIVNAEAHGEDKRRIYFSPCWRARAKGSKRQRFPPMCLSKRN